MTHTLPRHILLTLALSLLTMATYAQHRTRTTTQSASASAKVSRQFSDSLRHYADSIYADSVRVRQRLTATDVAPLFLPPTFYKDVPHKAFSLTDSLTTVDELMLLLYLNRPDLVLATQKQLEKAGPVLAPTTVTDKPAVEVAETKPAEAMPNDVDLIVLKPNFWSFGGDHYQIGRAHV